MSFIKIISVSVFSTLSVALISQDNLSSYRQALLEDTPIEEDLQELCDAIGGRVTGSEENTRAVEWAYNTFKDTGVEKVWKQPFEMPVKWIESSCKMTINPASSSPFSVLSVSKYQTSSGIRNNDIVWVDDLDSHPDDGSIKDKIIMVPMDLCLDIDGLFQEYTQAAHVELFARERGASGIIFMASRPQKLLYRFIGMKTSENDLPQWIMAREDAKRCQRLIQGGESLSVEIKTQAEHGGSFITHNVIAEITGSEKPEEIIVIGAHLDSWALGTGANDNGCNVSMMIDLARQMVKLGIKPKRTIRFALWNGEEQGYFGSWAYTQQYQHELGNTLLATSIDIGSGKIIGFFTNGREELVGQIDSLLLPVSDLGPFQQLNVPIVGTDNFDFMLEGVPNLVGSHRPATYGINYHAVSDTYDKVDIPSLKKNAAIVGTLILGYADSKMKLKRQSRDEISALFNAHNLEFTMRMFNVWESWVTGTRGRK